MLSTFKIDLNKSICCRLSMEESMLLSIIIYVGEILYGKCDIRERSSDRPYLFK
jgi:hypothetical protein